MALKNHSKWLLTAFRIVAFYAAYLILNRISYIDPITPFDITPWNPGLGLYVAAAALYGYRSLFVLGFAPLLADTVDREAVAAPAYSLLVGLLLVVETSLVTWLAKRLRNSMGGTPFALKEVSLLLAAIPAALTVAITHTGGLWLLGLLDEGQLTSGILRLWIGDIIGIVVMTPVLLRLIGSYGKRIDFSNRAELISQCIAIVACLWIIFGIQTGHARDYFYILYLPTIWIVLRYGAAGSVFLNMVLQAAIILSVSWGEAQGVSITEFQARFLVFAASSLTLGYAVDEIREATQKLRLKEGELAASVKAAATSELAGTLAHELSHPLGAISNYTAAIRHLLTENAITEVPPLLETLTREIGRATDAVHHLREFFRSGTLQLEKVDLGLLAQEAITLLSGRVSDSSIAVQVIAQEAASHVLGDKVQLLAVLHNLLINSIDALQSINVESRAVVVKVARAANSVHLDIDDSGIGVADDVTDHIFEPLITTKKAGLGLGLSMCRTIIMAHGGSIRLQPSLLGGARFEIILPAEETR